MWQRTKSGRRVRVTPLTRRAMRGQEPELHGLRRILGAVAPRVGLYSAIMPHPSLKLGADPKVVGFAFCDRPGLQGGVVEGTRVSSNHVSRDLGGQLKLRRVADGL